MCTPASLIVMKDRIFWSRFSESHEDIIEEYSLHMFGARGPNGVRVELSPPHPLNYADPIERWMLTIDQDMLPDWWDYEECLKRVRDVVREEWLPTKVVLPGEVRETIKNKHLVAVYGTVDYMWDVLVDEIGSNGRVMEVCGSSHINDLHGHGKIDKLRGNSVVQNASDNARIHSMYGWSRVIRLYGDAQIDWMSDESRVDLATDNSIIREITENASVGKVDGLAKIKRIGGQASAILHNRQKDLALSGNAVVIDCADLPKLLDRN